MRAGQAQTTCEELKAGFLDFLEHNLQTKILNIIEYKNLEDNWDFDDARAPTDKLIQKALYISRLLQKYGQKIYHPAPGPNGEIMLDIRSKSKSFEIIIYDHKTNIVFIPEDDVLPTQEEFDEKEIIRYISWLK